MSQRSIADWSGFWYTADFTLFTPTWFRKAPWEDPADFAARSPITHVAKVKTPLMLVDGDDDLRTPAVGWRRDDVPRAEVPEGADRDGALPRRDARAVALGQAAAPHRAAAAHRRLVRQVAAGEAKLYQTTMQ